MKEGNLKQHEKNFCSLFFYVLSISEQASERGKKRNFSIKLSHSFLRDFENCLMKNVYEGERCKVLLYLRCR